MNRRDLIKAMLAAPALALIPAIPAAAAPALSTPVEGLFIWMSGLRETSTHVGDAVTYAYDLDLAVAVKPEGPIHGVRRIWADRRCIYDTRPRQADESAEAYTERVALTAEIEQRLTVYPGTETQRPSPLIESYLGAEHTPAFRGLPYVTLKEFPVEQYGNRVPTFAFETR